MGSDDYSSAIGGGLKLKGAKPAGINKKKKKNKSKDKVTEGASESKKSALQKALEDEEADVRAEDSEEGSMGDGKTEAERKHEEMRRKRVSSFLN
jgi:protein FAM32A